MYETSWHGYPKVWALGHPNIKELFNGEITITEKIDGSQFSWGVFDGEIKVRSHNVVMDIDNPQKMFDEAISTVLRLAPNLINGWTYRGEYLRVPKHNTICYSRVPEQHIIVFDINNGYEDYLPYETMFDECLRLGLECVPLLRSGDGLYFNSDDFIKLLEIDSILGGSKIEGVVIKNYSQFGRDKKVLMGKYVSEVFKEKHQKEWKKGKDGFIEIISPYCTGARWIKAVQHLTEDNKLESSPKDIGALIPEILKDFGQEAKDEIMPKLWKIFFKKYGGNVVKGFPDWYKKQLMEKQFEETK